MSVSVPTRLGFNPAPITTADLVFNLVSRHVTAVAWPWCDGDGFVRVGLGHRLNTASDALELDWDLADELSGQRIPSAQTITDAFDRVANHRPRGRRARDRAGQQARLTPIRLTDMGLHASFTEDCLSALRFLERHIGPEFKAMPAAVVVALTAMCLDRPSGFCLPDDFIAEIRTGGYRRARSLFPWSTLRWSRDRHLDVSDLLLHAGSEKAAP